jgi:hypothetical protein
MGIELDELLFPDWAAGRSDGTYLEVGAVLPTRDGHKCGNACVMELETSGSITVAAVQTDAGNHLTLNKAELEELFYPPEWISKRVSPPHLSAAQVH